MANFLIIPGTHEQIDLDLLGYDPDLDDGFALDTIIRDCERLALEDCYD
jgi:hypothetical protein